MDSHCVNKKYNLEHANEMIITKSKSAKSREDGFGFHIHSSTSPPSTTFGVFNQVAMQYRVSSLVCVSSGSRE